MKKKNCLADRKHFYFNGEKPKISCFINMF